MNGVFMKKYFYPLILLNLIVLFFQVSAIDPIEKFFESLAQEGEKFVEKEAAKEKRKRHNRAVRILKKAQRKFGNDFECLNFGFDVSRKNCLNERTQKKQMNYANYFERIKELREKAENAEFDIDTTEPINSSLNAQDINRRMRHLQAEYIRFFGDKIHTERKSPDFINKKSKITRQDTTYHS